MALMEDGHHWLYIDIPLFKLLFITYRLYDIYAYGTMINFKELKSVKTKDVKNLHITIIALFIFDKILIACLGSKQLLITTFNRTVSTSMLMSRN